MTKKDKKYLRMALYGQRTVTLYGCKSDALLSRMGSSSLMDITVRQVDFQISANML